MASRFSDAPDLRPTYAETVADLVTKPAAVASSSVGKIALLLGLLAILGVVGFVMKVVTDGFDNRADWGYYVAIVSFMLSTTAGAPMVSIAPPLAKANWIRPVMRVAQMFSVAGIVTAIMAIPLIFMLPPLVEEGIRRRSIWFGSPTYYPHIWTTLAIVGLVVIGLALLWANSIPDLAAIRESGTGWRQRWARRLAPGFVGSTKQWNALKMRIGMLSAFYFLFLIFTHVLFASDYIHSMVAGWKDAIFPMYHALTSLQAGVASVIVASYFVRRWGGLERYLGLEQIWPLAKLQLALSLLWFYFFFSAFIIFWYGRTPFNANLIELLTHGPYLWAFLGALFFSFIIPMWTLMWNFIRVSIHGPVIIACFILAGTLLDRVRLAAGAWAASMEGLNDKYLQQVPATVWPDGWDLLMFIGAFSGAALLFLGITRFLPAVSLWEVSNARLLTKPGKYMRTHVQIVGKPD